LTEGENVDTILSEEQLRSIYDTATRTVTEQAAGIVLRQEPVKPPRSQDVCTVYTTFENSVHSGLAMCADTELFRRLTQRMMQTEHIAFEDVEDFSKEYFNVLCGHIAGALFRNTKVAARFQIPAFYRGWYQPKTQTESMELDFLSDENEGVRLIHYKAPTA